MKETVSGSLVPATPAKVLRFENGKATTCEPPRLTDEVRSMLKRSSDSELVGAVLALCDMFDEYDQAAARLIKGLGAVL